MSQPVAPPRVPRIPTAEQRISSSSSDWYVAGFQAWYHFSAGLRSNRKLSTRSHNPRCVEVASPSSVRLVGHSDTGRKRRCWRLLPDMLLPFTDVGMEPRKIPGG